MGPSSPKVAGYYYIFPRSHYRAATLSFPSVLDYSSFFIFFERLTRETIKRYIIKRIWFFFQYKVSCNPKKTETKDSADTSDLDMQRRSNLIERKFFSSSAILNFISESFDTNDDPNYSAKVCFNVKKVNKSTNL